ncbi:alpha/beta hydrolase [Vibrio inusitatus NBRC 102082]|uniref:Alpha/beta hydrolase n=1 Tax=Vibrio inusitatus NBRC 102082 TaxID=1219070 RepID=A0A4Y3HZS9_9VIBR|nr:alpha/beta fold hydrolase [Vibrio inusitatus]GEA52112.1 alpha/beta hydrolase [Vibrio inusitatus NBRC 102082]
MHGHTFINDGCCYQNYTFEAPLNYSDSESGTLFLFAREVRLVGDENSTKPWLIFFQGGPGFPSPRPNGHSGWLKAALQRYRVLLLDQRGTGYSSVITHQTLAHLNSEEQAQYLTHFRADNIVRDAELIREKLGIEKWATLGQSYGGFCTLVYLSLFPESLLQCYVTGGIPSIDRPIDDVYEATFKRTKDKNNAFFRQFPLAQQLCQKIANHLVNNEEFLPNGQKFTVEQFQQVGINFGVSDTFLPIYYLLENAFVTANGKEFLSYEFLNAMLSEQAFQTNPIYAILHEPIYCQGFASQWSAHRVRQKHKQFNYQPGQPFYFTGEMTFPWMFEQYTNLQPLQGAATLLSEKSDWGDLYNQGVLSTNKVPLSCAVYADDMFVEMALSCETLSKIPNSQAWITNEYEHNGLRADGERVLERLFTIGDQIEATLV